MKTIAGRGRRILSRIFRVVCVSAASLILQACYGIMITDEPAMYGPRPPEEIQETAIRGTVVSKQTGEPIFGIKVSIEGTNVSDRTNKDGYFYLRVKTQDVYKLIFEDVDGSYNDGEFQEQKWTIKQNDTYNNLLIGMDLVP
jgi:hypothetical protein